MEKIQNNKKKIWLPVLAVLVCAGLVAGIVFGRQAMEKQQEEKSWTEAYIAQSASRRNLTSCPKPGPNGKRGTNRPTCPT